MARINKRDSLIRIIMIWVQATKKPPSALEESKNRWNRRKNTTRYCAFWNLSTTRYGSLQRTRINITTPETL